MPWMRMEEMIPEEIPVRDRGGLLEESADPFSEEAPGRIEDFTFPEPSYAHPVPKLVRYVRIEAEGYPAAIS